jgi:transcriptional regulator with XRE-family HTH domain
MDILQQKQLIQIINQYNSIDKDIIKANLKRFMDASGLKNQYIAEQSKLSIQTIYQIRKVYNSYKVDFIPALLIADILNISITELMQPTEIKQPEQDTKWTITAKQDYVSDFNKMPITEVCEKYSVTDKTAKEYYRVFSLELVKLL